MANRSVRTRSSVLACMNLCWNVVAHWNACFYVTQQSGSRPCRSAAGQFDLKFPLAATITQVSAKRATCTAIVLQTIKLSVCTKVASSLCSTSRIRCFDFHLQAETTCSKFEAFVCPTLVCSVTGAVCLRFVFAVYMSVAADGDSSW